MNMTIYGDLLTPEARAIFAEQARVLEHYIATGEFHVEHSEHDANLALVPTVEETDMHVGSTFLAPAPARPSRARSYEQIGTIVIVAVLLAATGIIGLAGVLNLIP